MTWLRRMLARFFRRREPFSRTEKIAVLVSPVELGLFQTDAYRNGMTLDEWVRDRLNKGITQGTLLHLSKGHQSALSAAFEIRSHNGSRVVALPKKRETMADSSKAGTSGHPCRHLDPTLPPNMTRAECQGVCSKSKPGWNGRPCYWSAQAAKNCDEFETKINLPLQNPRAR